MPPAPDGRRGPAAATGGARRRGRTNSDTRTAANDAPLRRKHHAVPTVSTSTAASAGPKTRAPVITAVFSEVALEMSSGSTSSMTSPRRAGLSNALSTPSTRERTQTTPTPATPARSSTPSRIAWAARPAWVMMARTRLLRWSADRARPRAEQQHRQELQGDGDPEVGCPPGEAIHQQRHRRELQPGADVGDEQSGEEHATRSNGACCGTWPIRATRRGLQSSSLRAEMNTSPGTSTRPIDFIFFLPSFCRSRSLRLRVMSPP